MKLDRKRKILTSSSKIVFSGRSVNKDGRPGGSIKKAAHSTRVHDMWPFGPLVFFRSNPKSKRPKGPQSCTLSTFWKETHTNNNLPKNFLDGVEFSITVKFPQIPFCGFREEVENVSAIQRPGSPSWFSYRPGTYTLGRGRWDLSSCQISLNSVQRFQRRSW